MGAGCHLEHVLHYEQALARCPQRGLLIWDTRVKLVCLLLVIIGNTWLALPWLSALLLIIGAGFLVWTRLPWQHQRAFLLVPLAPMLFIVAGAGFGFGVTPLLHAGPMTLYQEGLLQGAGIALRAYCDVVWLLACVATSPFPQVLDAMRWFRIPGILVDTLAMMYRYIFVLYTEFRRMRLASRARGGCAGFRAEMAALSRIAGQLLIRSFDRSERIYWAMAARGGEQYD